MEIDGCALWERDTGLEELTRGSSKFCRRGTIRSFSFSRGTAVAVLDGKEECHTVMAELYCP